MKTTDRFHRLNSTRNRKSRQFDDRQNWKQPTDFCLKYQMSAQFYRNMYYVVFERVMGRKVRFVVFMYMISQGEVFNYTMVCDLRWLLGYSITILFAEFLAARLCLRINFYP